MARQRWRQCRKPKHSQHIAQKRYYKFELQEFCIESWKIKTRQDKTRQTKPTIIVHWRHWTTEKSPIFFLLFFSVHFIGLWLANDAREWNTTETIDTISHSTSLWAVNQTDEPENRNECNLKWRKTNGKNKIKKRKKKHKFLCDRNQVTFYGGENAPWKIIG